MNTLEFDRPGTAVLVEALDTYVRVCMGQFEIAEEVLRNEIWNVEGRGSAVSEGAQRGLRMAKMAMGQHPNSSFGIAHPAVDATAKRCWEMKKVVERTLAIDRDPENRHHTQRDGLTILRYTDDPEPTATVAVGTLAVSAEPIQWEAAGWALRLYEQIRKGELEAIHWLAEIGMVPVRVDTAGGNANAIKLREADPAVAERLVAALEEASYYVAMAGPIGGTVAPVIDSVAAAIAQAALPDSDGPLIVAGP